MALREHSKRITTLYQGWLAPVLHKFVKTARNSKANLKIIYQDQYMIVPLSNLEKPFKQTRVPDKFISGKINKLYYYKWSPIDTNQPTLLDGEKNEDR